MWGTGVGSLTTKLCRTVAGAFVGHIHEVNIWEGGNGSRMRQRDRMPAKAPDGSVLSFGIEMSLLRDPKLEQGNSLYRYTIPLDMEDRHSGRKHGLREGCGLAEAICKDINQQKHLLTELLEARQIRPVFLKRHLGSSTCPPHRGEREEEGS